MGSCPTLWGLSKQVGWCVHAPVSLEGYLTWDWGHFMVALHHLLPLGSVLLLPLAAVLRLLVASAPGALLTSLLCLFSFWKEGN